MVRIGLGVIGAGAIAERAHLPVYSKMPEVKLVGIAEINAERCKALARRFNIPNWYEDYHKLLENREIQAVSICTPPDTHAEIAVAAAEARKHVLCEKPMALQVEDADRMIEAAERNNVKLMVGHSLRYLENFRVVRHLLMKRTIGRVVFARLELTAGGPFLSWPAVSRYYREKGRGGEVLFNFGTHAVDLLRWVINDEVRNVCALIGTYGVVPEIVGKEIDDRALALLEFEGGSFGEICVAYVTTSFENLLEICGTKGKIVTDLQPPSPLSMKRIIRLYRGDKGPYVINVNQVKGDLCLEIEDFIRWVRKGKEPRVSAYDGKKAVKVVLAIYESYRERFAKHP